MRRSKNRRVFTTDSLEVRQVLSALTAVADFPQTPLLPADARSFPTVTMNVLNNDLGTGLRVTGIDQPQLGTVELLPGAPGVAEGTLRFTPGPGFRGQDVFTYTVADAAGQTAAAAVFVRFEQDPTPYGWQVRTVPEVFAAAGVTTPLRGADGTPGVQLDYRGTLPASAGVLLRWSFVSGGFSGIQFPGDFVTDTIRTDAEFYSYSNGSCWIYGSVDGVNALLSDLDYVPERGYAAPEGVELYVQSHLYSAIGVNLGSEFGSLIVRVAESEMSPQAIDDVFSVRTSLEPSFLDVLANDESGVSSGFLELVDSQLGGHSQATLSIDVESQRLVYQPPTGFMGTDVIAYTVRNAAGVEAQGRVEVNVMPPILAVLGTSTNRTTVEVINAETMGMISQFEAFQQATTNVMVEVADLDSDGFMEVVVLQTSGERRMRSFNAYGGLLSDTVMQPFGSRFAGPMDLSIGDLDDDGRAEMVLVASTARGFELRSIDSSTGVTEMSMVMRGMSGAPQVAVDENTDEIVILGRTAGGGVAMAMVDVDSSAPQQIARRILVTDRDARTLQRQNGQITSLTLSASDLDGNGATEAVVGMTFRNGAARVMTAGTVGGPKVMMNSRVTLGTRTLILPASSLFSDSGAMVGWWTTGSLGMLDSTATPLQRRRILGVALG